MCVEQEINSNLNVLVVLKKKVFIQGCFDCVGKI